MPQSIRSERFRRTVFSVRVHEVLVLKYLFNLSLSKRVLTIGIPVRDIDDIHDKQLFGLDGGGHCADALSCRVCTGRAICRVCAHFAAS